MQNLPNNTDGILAGEELFVCACNGRTILCTLLCNYQWRLCEYVIVHMIWGGSPVILSISLGGKPKWLPLKFGYYDVMRTSPIYAS